MLSVMVRTFAFAMLLVAAPLAASAAPANASADEVQIRKLLDDWAKGFHDKNIAAIMSMYLPGDTLVAYDLVPPLQYKGYDAYKKDYVDFLAQFKGPIEVEYRDLHIAAGDKMAYGFGLERLTGTMTSGEKSDMWVRFTSVFRKIDGRWYDVHDHVSVPTDMATGKSLTALAP